MEDVTRRDAARLLAAGAAATGVFALAGTNAEAQDEKKSQPYQDKAAKRWDGRKTASRDDLKELSWNGRPRPSRSR